MKWCK